MTRKNHEKQICARIQFDRKFVKQKKVNSNSFLIRACDLTEFSVVICNFITICRVIWRNFPIYTQEPVILRKFYCHVFLLIGCIKASLGSHGRNRVILNSLCNRREVVWVVCLKHVLIWKLFDFTENFCQITLQSSNSM